MTKRDEYATAVAVLAVLVFGMFIGTCFAEGVSRVAVVQNLGAVTLFLLALAIANLEWSD